MAELQQSKYQGLPAGLPSELSMQLAEVALALGSAEDQVTTPCRALRYPRPPATFPGGHVVVAWVGGWVGGWWGEWGFLLGHSVWKAEWRSSCKRCADHSNIMRFSAA